MQCTNFQRQLDDFLDGALPAAEHTALQQHRQACPGCRQLHEKALQLQMSLRRLPVAPPSPGFFSRVLKRAHRSAPGAIQLDWLKIQLDWLRVTAAASALTVALFTGYFVGNLSGDGDHGAITVALAPQQTQTIHLAFQSARALDDVELTLMLPEQIEIDGYPGQRRLSWRTDLAQGDNRLSLPLIINDKVPPTTDLVARLDHPTGSRTFRIQAQVAQAAAPENT